jgi:hypothetical protein
MTSSLRLHLDQSRDDKVRWLCKVVGDVLFSSYFCFGWRNTVVVFPTGKRIRNWPWLVVPWVWVSGLDVVGNLLT